jgi:hypothetical protein
VVPSVAQGILYGGDLLALSLGYLPQHPCTLYGLYSFVQNNWTGFICTSLYIYDLSLYQILPVYWLTPSNWDRVGEHFYQSQWVGFPAPLLLAGDRACLWNVCNIFFGILNTRWRMNQYQWPHGLRCRYAAAHLLRLWVQIPPRAWMSVVIVVCCQVEVSVTSWSLIQRSAAHCGATLYVNVKPCEWGGPGPMGLCCHARSKHKQIDSEQIPNTSWC